MSALMNIQAFWNEFEQANDEIRNHLVCENYEALAQTIDYFDSLAMKYMGSHFFVELAYDAFECTFDTGPNKTSQYLAQLAVDLAPASIANAWIINPTLPPMSQKAVQAALKIKDSEFHLNDLYVFYETDLQAQTISCLLYCPGYSQIDNDERKKEMSMYLIELAIGQTAYEAYLSRVDYLDQPDPDMDFCNLIDFYEVIMNRVDTAGWKTYRVPTDIYSIYRPTQDIAHDTLRKDMKFIFTTHPLLIEETIEGKIDVVSDLVTKGGQFGYVYYLNPFRNEKDALFRQELSRKLDKQMTDLHLGQVIGGAIGKSYSYIDWIMYDEAKFNKVFAEIKKQVNTTIELEWMTFSD